MAITSPANEREEMKAEVLARLDELERHLTREIRAARMLTAQYWPVEVATRLAVAS